MEKVGLKQFGVIRKSFHVFHATFQLLIMHPQCAIKSDFHILGIINKRSFAT